MSQVRDSLPKLARYLGASKLRLGNTHLLFRYTELGFECLDIEGVRDCGRALLDLDGRQRRAFESLSTVLGCSFIAISQCLAVAYSKQVSVLRLHPLAVASSCGCMLLRLLTLNILAMSMSECMYVTVRMYGCRGEDELSTLGLRVLG
jgi:hypothetical protein